MKSVVAPIVVLLVQVYGCPPSHSSSHFRERHPPLYPAIPPLPPYYPSQSHTAHPFPYIPPATPKAMANPAYYGQDYHKEAEYSFRSTGAFKPKNCRKCWCGACNVCQYNFSPDACIHCQSCSHCCGVDS